ncbi:MAG TPA: VWA domain-containing protein [Candidatus Angelobacter sp.]
MNGYRASSPYVGLRPFREQDRAFFFGRERETRVISSNVIEESLTILYGPSGAGKSSALQAGVIPYLKSIPKAAVVYFRNWQGDSFAEELKAKVVESITAVAENTVWEKEDELHDILSRTECQVFLLLDQFEEFLLYHSGREDRNGFDSVLARLVNGQDIKAKVLIGIREDGLSKLNQRFAIRIRDLLGNTLEVERLSMDAARNAIEKPLEVFNKIQAADGITFSIETDLVLAILEQVREGRASTGDSVGLGGTRAARGVAQVETAYLQLVLTQLWHAERQQNSPVMRLQTLQRMGGASQIVRDHVNSVMNHLESDESRDIAARMFLYLVTPSRTKIAQRTEDLVCFGGAHELEVKSVLNALTDQEDSRILRRLSNPEQYEIFHDVLAQHILEWRHGYEQRKELAKRKHKEEAEAARKQRELEQAQELAKAQKLRADEQAASARRLRMMVIALVSLFALAVVAAFYGFIEERKARQNAAKAAAYAERAESVQQREKAELQELQATIAERDGNRQLAAQLRQQAEDSRTKADTAAQMASQQGVAAFNAAQELLHAKAERDKYASQVQSLQKALDDAQEKVKSLQKALDDARAGASRKTGSTQPQLQASESKRSEVTGAVSDHPITIESPKSNPSMASTTGHKTISTQITVIVVDDWNRIVTGLAQEVFRVFEDKIEQRLVSSSTKDDPVSIAIVFDLGTAFSDATPRLQEATVEFLKTANPLDEFLLIESNDHGKVVMPFTKELADLQNTIPAIRPGKGASLCDSVYLALNEMKNAKNAQKVIFILSDAIGDHSNRSASKLLSEVRMSDVQIYSVAIYDEINTINPSDIISMQELLNRLGDESGGRSFVLTQKEMNALGDAAAKIAIGMRNQYTLEYIPTNQSRDGKYRHVQIRLSPPKGLPFHLNSYFRQGYFAPSR